MGYVAAKPDAIQANTSNPRVVGGADDARASAPKTKKLACGSPQSWPQAKGPHSAIRSGAGAMPELPEWPEWADRSFSWVASVLLHAGVLLLLVFAWEAISTVRKQHAQAIIVPQAMDQSVRRDPGGVVHPRQSGNPAQSAREQVRRLTSDSWNAAESPWAVSLLNHSNQAVNLIAVGPIGGATSGGLRGPFCNPGGGMPHGPRSTIFIKGGSARRIVYIIDHEGDMLENFSVLKRELRKSIRRLTPVQSFAVIIFRRHYRILGPARLMHATLPNKKLFYKLLAEVAPHGRAEYRFQRFYRPFKAAFQMHPQVVHFLTSGAFDPRLIAAVARLNRNHRARIFTYAYTNQDLTFTKNLKLLARQNGGEYRYVSRAQIGD